MNESTPKIPVHEMPTTTPVPLAQNLTLNPSDSRSKPVIGICVPSVSIKGEWTSLKHASLQTVLVPSIVRTVMLEERAVWEVRLYLGIDDNDAFWLKWADKIVKPVWLTIKPGFYKKAKLGRIPHREMTQAAFDDGAEYIVRINDDTEFVSSGWITKGVATLRGFDPPNVGIVAPKTLIKNRRGDVQMRNVEGTDSLLLVHDMVHRTHMQIFEHYYPYVFDNYFLDDWMSLVYLPDNVKVIGDWEVNHLTKLYGQRYKAADEQRKYVKPEVEKGQQLVKEWIAGVDEQRKYVKPEIEKGNM